MNFNGGTVEYRLDANADNFLTSLEEVEAEFDRLTDKLADAKLTSATRKDVQDTVDNLQALKQRLADTSAGTEEYDSALIQANQELEYFKGLLGETNTVATESTSVFGSLASTLGSISFKGISAGATAGTAALTKLASKGIQATNYLQTSRTAMSGLLGSMEEGTKAMSIAANYFSNNPFSRFDVVGATKQLVQYGRTVDQLNGDLKTLGDISIGTGVGLEELAIKYGRIASSNRATNQDIETLANRGIPIYRELAKVLGTTTDGVREFAAEGKINFQVFKEAMEGAVDPTAIAEYEKTLDRAKDKISGTIASLAGALAGYTISASEGLQIKDKGLYTSWVNLIRAVAGDSKEGTGLRNPKLVEGLTKIGDALAKVIDMVTQHVEPVFQTLAKIVDFLGEHTEALIPIALLALRTLTGFISKIPGIGGLVSGLDSSLGKLGSTLLTFAQAHPIISAIIALFTVGFAKLVKEDDKFRESLKKLFTSIVTIVKSLIPIVTTLVQTFMSLAASESVTWVLKTLVEVLAWLAETIASIPEDTLILIVTVIAGLKLAQINPWLLYASALGAIALKIRDLIQEAGGLKKIFETVKSFFSNAAQTLYQAGGDFIAGFWKGVNEAWSSVKTGIQNIFASLVNSVKNILGIHSPSTVMYGIGQNLGIGLANGIEDSKNVVQVAMDNLAKDVLKTAEKVIGNMSDFGLIDYNGTYKQWKRVANLFTIGSEQYETAIQKMEDARKNVNLEIIKLQKQYNDTLDSTIKKIQGMYNLFDTVDLTGGKSATQIIKDLDQQVAQTAEWAESLSAIEGLGLDQGLVEELREMGVSSTSELSAIANMTTSELEQLNSLWLQKQSIATASATEQLEDYKNETLDQIRDLADGIDGETVDVQDVGGRLVASLSEGITGALPTLEGSMSQLGDYIAEARRKLSGDSTGTAGVADTETDEDPFGLKKLFEDAQTNLEKGINKLGIIAAGLVGTSILFKVLSGTGIAGKLKDGLFGGLGKLFGKGGTSAVASQGMGSVDLSGINKTTSQLGETASSASKVGEWSVVIAKAALAIAAIAVAIAAIAGAIWVMDKALDGIDWGTFISKLGMVAVATVAMGALAYVVSKLDPAQMALGAAAILLLAVDVAAIAGAIWVANMAMDGIGWGEFMSKIGMMAVAIVAMGVLAAIAGIPAVAALVAIGAVVIMALAADIVLVSAAIGFMDLAIPDDLDRVRGKLALLCEAIAAFELLSGVAGVFALVEGLGILVILGIADEIRQVAVAIGIMAAVIPNDLNMVQDKLGMLKSVISQMGEANFGNVIKNVVQAARIKTLKPTIDEFVNIASSLRNIQGINVTQDDIFGIMSALNALVGSGETLASFATLGKTAAQSVATGLQEGLAYIEQAGVAIQGALWASIQAKFPDEYQQGVYLVREIYNGGMSMINLFENLGREIQSKLWWGIQNRMQDEYYQGRSMGERFRQGLYDVDYGNAGWWAVQGFINGAWGRAGSYDGLYNTGRWLAEVFLQGIEDRGRQGSPWKTTMESGKYAAEGLIDGMESMESQVINEAETLADGIIGALDMSDTTLSPELSVRSSLAPSSGFAEEFGYSSERGVTVNQSITNYSEYDVSQNVRDLSYMLSRI